MKIIAVSDIHLGYEDSEIHEYSDEKSFGEFLDKLANGGLPLKNDDKITDFIICGDFLDMWRRDMAGVAIEHFEILKKLQGLEEQHEITVHYLAGNHDYHIYKNLSNKYNYPFGLRQQHPPREELSIPAWNKIYRFKHGYDFEVLMSDCERFFDLLSSTSDEAGEQHTWLWDLISKIISVGGQYFEIAPNKDKMRQLRKPFAVRIQDSEAKSGFNNSLSGALKENSPLIFGHTHMPFHYENDDKTAINLGSWIASESRQYDTYLEITDGQEILWDYRKETDIKPTDVLPTIM